MSREPTPAARLPLGLDVALWSAIALCGAMIAAAVVLRLSVAEVWDDAFMFGRYAGNILRFGRVSWNPGGPATYGLTSPLFLAIVLPLWVILPGSPGLVAVLSSLACGAAFLALFLALVRRTTPSDPLTRRVAFLLPLFAFAVVSVNLSAHFMRGMDTAFAMAWLTAFMLLAKWGEASGSRRSLVVVGLWAGATYFARPDLLLFTLGAPAAMVVLGSSRQRRRQGLAILGVAAAVLAAELAAAAAYFGSALPLPFYAKGLRQYGELMVQRYRTIPVRHLVQYCFSFLPLLLVIGVALLVRFGGLMRRLSAGDKGLVAATLLFFAYYATMVLQISAYKQRFYYPTLPVVAYLAVQSAVALLAGKAGPAGGRLRAPPAGLYVAGAVVFLGLLAPSALWMHEYCAAGVLSSDFGHFDVAYASRTAWSAAYWFRLGQFSALPDDLVLATSEIGLPGVMNPNKQIVDLSGLNETEWALHGFSAARLFSGRPPDLFYIHPDYEEMNREIFADPYFVAHYDWFPGRALGAQLGVALWRDSPHYRAMRAIAEAKAQ